MVCRQTKPPWAKRLIWILCVSLDAIALPMCQRRKEINWMTLQPNASFQNLTAKGCSGGTNTCFKAGLYHFVPKKSDIPADALMTLETNFGALRPELKWGQGDTHHVVVSRPSRRASQQNVEDGPGLATDCVVFCNLRHNKTTKAKFWGV